MVERSNIKRVGHRSIFLALLLISVLATSIGDSSVYDISGTRIGTIRTNYFTSDTVMLDIPFTKKLTSTTYIDYPFNALIKNIPDNPVGNATHKVMWGRTYYQNQTYATGNIMVTLTGGDGVERILPYDYDFFNTFCYVDGAPNMDCSVGDFLNQAGIVSVLPTIDASIVHIRIYLGGSMDMSRLRMNSTYGTTATQLVPYEQLVWPTRIKHVGSTNKLYFYNSEGTQDSEVLTVSSSVPWWGVTLPGYAEDASYLSPMGDTGACVFMYINTHDYSSSAIIQSPTYISIEKTGCNLYGMGASTGSGKFGIYPEFFSALIYASGGTPTKTLNSYCTYAGALDNVPTFYYGIGLNFSTAGTKNLNKENITYHYNSSLAVVGGCQTSYSNPQVINSIYVLSNDQTMWKQIDYFGQESTASSKSILQIYPNSTIPTATTATFWWATYYKSATPMWGSIDSQIEAYSREQGPISKTAYYSSFEGECEPVGSDPCLIPDEAYGKKILTDYRITCKGNSRGYYNSCGSWTECSYCSSCSTDGEGLHCGSDCYGYWYYSTCQNGDAYGVFSCGAVNMTYPLELKDSCQGAGCKLPEGVCNDRSSLATTFFSVTTHLKDSTIGNATVQVTGYDPYSVPYNANCTTATYTDNGCYIDLMPGRWNVTGSAPGYVTGAEDCSGISPQPLGTYSQGCSFKVDQGQGNSMEFSLLAAGENANSTRLDFTVMFRNEPLDEVLVNVSGYDTRSTDNNGKATMKLSLTDPDLTIVFSKEGYETKTITPSVNIGRIVPITVFLDKSQTLFINTGQTGPASHVFSYMMGSSFFLSGPPSTRIPIQTDKPGTIEISREDVIVHPCKDYFCQTFQKVGVNVLWVFGPAEGWYYEVMDDPTYGQTLHAIDSPTWHTILTKGSWPDTSKDTYKGFSLTQYSGEFANKCNFIDGTSGITIKGRDQDYEVLGSINFIPCTYEGTTHKLLVSTHAPTELNAITESLDRIARASEIETPIGTRTDSGAVAIKPVWTSIFEVGAMMMGLKQDVVTDYILFNVDPVSALVAGSDNNVYTVTVNGASIQGTPSELVVNPVYSTLLRNGIDPAIMDSGSLVQNNLIGDPDDVSSYSSPITYLKLEKQSWQTPILKGSLTVRPSGKYEYDFNYPTYNLVIDVVKDLKNHRYASADVEFFEKDNEGRVPGYVSATKMQISTYLKIVFTPSDGSVPQTDYVRIDIPFSQDDYTWVGIGVLILGLIVILGPLILKIKVKRK
jgi:hypothetical protein